jgi:cytochrome c peroxidase
MHNGSFKTLLDVLKHYNEGGKHSQQQDSLIKPLHLTMQDMLDIIEFMKTLTDSKFITDLRFKDPWKS